MAARSRGVPVLPPPSFTHPGLTATAPPPSTPLPSNYLGLKVCKPRARGPRSWGPVPGLLAEHPEASTISAPPRRLIGCLQLLFSCCSGPFLLSPHLSPIGVFEIETWKLGRWTGSGASEVFLLLGAAISERRFVIAKFSLLIIALPNAKGAGEQGSAPRGTRKSISALVEGFGLVFFAETGSYSISIILQLNPFCEDGKTVWAGFPWPCVHF